MAGFAFEERELKDKPLSKVAIYVLADPSGNIRYVGKAKNPKRRFQQHCRPSIFDETPKAIWLRGLLKSGFLPIMTVAEWTEDWEEAERIWIVRLRKIGVDLLNVAEGGAPVWPKGKLRGRQPVTPYRRIMHRIGMMIRDSKASGRMESVARLEFARDAFHKKARREVKAHGRAGMITLNADLARSFGHLL